MYEKLAGQANAAKRSYSRNEKNPFTDDDDRNAAGQVTFHGREAIGITPQDAIKGEIPCELTKQQGCLNHLEALLMDLMGRLHPVSRPDDAKIGRDGEAATPMPLAPFAYTLREHTQQLDRLIYVVSNQLSRLELP